MKTWQATLAVVALALGAACTQKTVTESPAPVDEAPVTEAPVAQTGAKVGDQAPALTVVNAHNWEGGPQSLDDLKGKVVVLDFWAYW